MKERKQYNLLLIIKRKLLILRNPYMRMSHRRLQQHLYQRPTLPLSKPSLSDFLLQRTTREGFPIPTLLLEEVFAFYASVEGEWRGEV